MRISTLIATCNRAELLEKAITSVLRCTKPTHEIVVADQSDDDRSEQVCRRLDTGGVPVRHLRLDRRGKSRALNEAIRTSSGDYLALTDDDVEVDPGWLATIEQLAARHRGVAAFCGRVLPEPGTDPGHYLNLVQSKKPRRITRRSSPLSPGFCGANIAVERATMLAVGGYSEHFGPGGVFRNNDDGELAYRLTRGGTDILFAPELVVYHSGWRRETDNLDLRFDYTYGIGALAGHYLRRGRPLPTLYLVRRCLPKTLTVAQATLRRRPGAASDVRVQLRGFVRGFLRGLRVSRPGTLPAANSPRARNG